ncbi:MAG: 2'-5' RNA ligase family protein [Salibacteraceae bacterium]
MSKARFFIALVPPEALSEEIMVWKRYFERQFNSRAALRSPPHLTLHMPFLWPEKRESELHASFSALAQSSSDFTIHLQGFGAFPPRVIYVAVAPQPELLAFQEKVAIAARKELHLLHPTHKGHGFHPHITVAFRDLRKTDFETAWKQLETTSFKATWNISDLAVLKHDGKRWNIWQQFPLSEQM